MRPDVPLTGATHILRGLRWLERHDFRMTNNATRGSLCVNGIQSGT